MRICMVIIVAVLIGGCNKPKVGVSCSVDTKEIKENKELLYKCKENPEFKISVPF